MTNNIELYAKQPAQMSRFQSVIGRGANGYVQSVIIAVSMNPELMECTEESIIKSALRAASLGLSCDPAQREAHLVPRNKKVKGRDGQPDRWIKEASFELHYLGLYKLAIRTNKYWTINVIPVMKHQDVRMGRDGLHYVFEGDMKIDHFPVDRVTARNLPGVKGWLGYFKTTKGFEKTSYMSVEEIMEHAQKYSRAYQYDLKNNKRGSKWSDPDVLPTMQMKTVLRDLLKWADTSGDAGAMLREALEHDADSENVIDAEAESVDGEYPEGSEWPADMTDDEPPIKQDADDTIAELMGEPTSKAKPRPDSRPWTVAQKKALLDAGYAKNDFGAKGMLGLSMLPEDATPAECAAWGKVYFESRWNEDGSEKTKSSEAAAIANAELFGA